MRPEEIISMLADFGYSIEVRGHALAVSPKGAHAEILGLVRENRLAILCHLAPVGKMEIPDLIREVCRKADAAGRNTPEWSRLSSLIDRAMKADGGVDPEDFPLALVELRDALATKPTP